MKRRFDWIDLVAIVVISVVVFGWLMPALQRMFTQ